MLVSFIPFIDKTIIITTRSNDSAAKAQPTAIKNDFKIRFSFDLKPIIIEKSIIEINIKNSTITKTANSVKDKPIETFPVTSVVSKNLIVVVKFGPAYIIKSEVIKQAKAIDISIRAVKYFEFIS